MPVLLAVHLALSSLLACGGTTSDAPVAEPQPQPQPQPAAFAGPMTSTPETLALAHSLGFPPDGPGLGLTGPFAGADGGLYYVSREGRASYLQPDSHTAWLAQLDAHGQPTLAFVLASDGSYGVTPEGLAPIPPPKAASTFPYWMEMVEIASDGKGKSLPSPTLDQAEPVVRSLTGFDLRALIDLGAEGCTQHPVGEISLGCW